MPTFSTALIRRVALAVFFVPFASPSLADRLAAHWQEAREHYNAISYRACDGDRSAREYLGTESWDSMEPVAMTALAWLIRPNTTCEGFEHNRQDWIELTRTAATEFYYPVAMQNWGFILASGTLGMPQDMDAGIHWLQNAMDEGVSGAAYELAMIHARGRFGGPRDLDAAEFYFRRAQQLGLPNDLLEDVEDAIRAARSAGPAQPVPAVPEATGQPNAPAPPANDGGTGNGAPFFVTTETGRTGDRVPRIGDVQNMGSWDQRVVYVAELFLLDQCWSASGAFLVGYARENIDPLNAFRLDNLLENSDTQRAAGQSSQYVTDFRSLRDGIAFVQENPRIYDPAQRGAAYTLADARAYGARCPNNDYLEVTYPAPVFAPGF